MQSWERHHVHGQLPQISVQLSGEPQARRDTRHGHRDQVVQVTVRRRRELERTEANVVQRLVVYAIRLVSVLQQLVNRQGSVVRFNYSVGHLRRRNDRVSVHDAIRVLFADLGDQYRP